MVYAVKINNGRAEIYDASTGSYQRSLTDATSAQMLGGNLVQVTKQNGRVEIYDASTGSYQRSL
jgi:ABC-type tungstate transport system substrate-binding protein